MDDLTQVIAKQIKAARRRNGFRQVDLARMSGIHAHLLWHYENEIKSPQVRNLIKIADACNVSVDFLVGRER